MLRPGHILFGAAMGSILGLCVTSADADSITADTLLSLCQENRYGCALYINGLYDGYVLGRNITHDDAQSLSRNINGLIERFNAGDFENVSPETLRVISDVGIQSAMLERVRHICVPKGVTPGQISDVVIKWLRDNPQLLDDPAPIVFFDALTVTYPCSEK